MRLSWPKRWQKKTHLSRELLLYSPKDFFISFLLYAASVFVCLILRHFDTSKATSYVAMIFLLDVFLTAFFTDGFLFSIPDGPCGFRDLTPLEDEACEVADGTLGTLCRDGSISDCKRLSRRAITASDSPIAFGIDCTTLNK